VGRISGLLRTGWIESGLTHRPAVALVAIVLRLLFGLAIARIHVDITRAATAAVVRLRGLLVGAARIRATLGLLDRWRIGHHIPALGGTPGVVEAVPVVVRNAAPPVGHVTDGKDRQIPGPTRVVPAMRPVPPVPVASRPGMSAVVVAAVVVARRGRAHARVRRDGAGSANDGGDTRDVAWVGGMHPGRGKAMARGSEIARAVGVPGNTIVRGCEGMAAAVGTYAMAAAKAAAEVGVAAQDVAAGPEMPSGPEMTA